ncbi:ankyrin repeat domain-containing protein [Akkermansiaceae bacterium]|nr:ankyrin repeat domain-containing protein [Akkermansiaceae bacterium]
MQPLHAELKARDVEKHFKGEFKKFGMSFDLDRSMKDDNYGTALNAVETKRSLGTLFAALDRLDTNFVENANIREVFFRHPLIDPVSKLPVRGLGGGSGKMWFNNAISMHAVFHELFHVFDKKGKEWSKWDRTNPKGFTYTGSKFRTEDLNRSEKRRNEESKDLIAGAFVSEYAKSNQSEDRAETFTQMIKKGHRIMAEAEENEYLMEKIEIIIDMTSSTRLLGDAYWDTLLASDIGSIKKFSRSGFANRLMIDLEKKSLKPDEVIKVNNEEIVPLIFALEMDNTELIKLLCKRGVDPNVSNKKGETALELAMKNENEIQVNTLKEQGAE